MKMIYHSKNKPKYKKRFLTIIIFFVLVFIFFGKSFTTNLNNNIFSGIFTARDFIFSPFNNFFSYLNSKKNLQNKADELQTEIKRLETENLTVEILRNENANLKNILNVYENQTDFKLAKVLLSTPFTPYDTLIINLGEGEVFVDQKVFFGSVMLGKISEVYKNTSQVKLISAPGQKVVVRINDLHDVEAEGIGNLGFRASLPKDLALEKGFIVSVKDSEIPAILGPIEEIITNDTSTFQDVYFNVPLKMSDINYVEIKN